MSAAASPAASRANHPGRQRHDTHDDQPESDESSHGLFSRFVHRLPISIAGSVRSGAGRSWSSHRDRRRGSAFEVLAASTRLGLTSFGGPIAHLGYFREEYVVRRKWMDEETYADLVALCQFLPGPASSQVGIALGIMRAGPARRAGGLDRLHAALGGRADAFAYGVGALDARTPAGCTGSRSSRSRSSRRRSGAWRARSPDRARGTIAIVAAPGRLASRSPGGARC